MKTIDELWYGNVSPFEQCTRGDKRWKELLKLVAGNREKLGETLTKKQKETLEKFEECMSEMHSITERDAFSYYKLDDKDKGMEYLRMAEEQNFEPARAAITQIQYNYNARIVAGVFNLFYYASRIIDEDAEDMYPHPAFADVDMRAKREDRAKRMGLTMGGM